MVTFTPYYHWRWEHGLHHGASGDLDRRGTGDGKYLEQALRWGEARGWKLGERPRNADDQSPGQTYLELYMLKKEPARLAQTKSVLDAMVATPRPGREDWWWCDALFMAPPVLTRLYAVTGDRNANWVSPLSSPVSAGPAPL